MQVDYRDIFERLNKEDILYVVAGGVAVNLHGIPRMTYDVDLICYMQSANLTRLVNVLLDLGYRPRAPVDPHDLEDEEKRARWKKEKHLRAFSFYSDTQPIAEIDVIVDCAVPFQDLRGRALHLDLDGILVPLISIQDLIELKEHTGRKQDASDVKHLKGILNERE